MGNRADPMGACGIEKGAGGQKDFENFKGEVFHNLTGRNCLDKRNGLSERVFKVAKGKRFEGDFEKEVFHNSSGRCSNERKENLKQDFLGV